MLDEPKKKPAEMINQPIGRPSGEGAMKFGAACGVIGLFAIFVSFVISDSGLIDDFSIFQWPFVISAIGGGLISLGVLIWVSGYIVSAISWLPHKD